MTLGLLLFVLALLVAWPFGLLLRRIPQAVPRVWSVVGLLPFVLPAAAIGDVALVSWPWFPGYTHGLEVTLLDLLVLSLRIGQGPSRGSSPLRIPRFLFLAAVVLSIPVAVYPLAASFVAWQLVRMYLLFSVVERACRDPRVPMAVLNGMAAGVLLTAALSVAQRYLLGHHEVFGTFSHQNIVGMMCNFAVMPSLALLLAGRASPLMAATPVAGAVAVILSLSRGGLIMLIAGLGLVVGFSMRRFTLRKAGIVGAALILGGALVSKALDQITIRFTERSWGSFDSGEVLDERARLELASAMMLHENPLGVGANHHTWVLRQGGYFERAGLTEHGSGGGGSGTAAIKVHNLYWLTATEMGYAGIVAFLWLAAALLATVCRSAWRARHQTSGDVIFALGVALLLFLVQGLVEWIQLEAIPQYAFWMTAALAIGLGRPRPEAAGRRGHHPEGDPAQPAREVARDGDRSADPRIGLPGPGSMRSRR